jgi:allantoate deiminase
MPVLLAAIMTAAPAEISPTLLSRITRSVAARLDEIARIGRDPRGGWSRLAFTNSERDAHDLFQRWGVALGLDVHRDSIGNSYARLGHSTQPAVMIGSHLDTVVTGGAYDGTAGVVAAFEALNLLRDGPDLRHRLEIVAFAAEEGARFTTPCIGSRFITGQLSLPALKEIRDVDGITAYDAARSRGLDPDRAQTEVWRPLDVHCFLELHVEQGQVLEAAGARIGIVEAIAGATRLVVTLTGAAAHSGTTPMPLRKDPLVAASKIITFAEETASRYARTVATVGRIRVTPDSPTTIPGEATFSLDVRSLDAIRQREVSAEIVRYAEVVAAGRRLGLAVRVLHDQSPHMLHYWVRQELTATVASTGTPYRVLASGAGHDAGVVGHLIPSGMIFVPSHGGISHSPAESSDPADIALGSFVLAQGIRRLDEYPLT